MRSRQIIAVLMAILLYSCGAKKSGVEPSAIELMPAKKLIEQHYATDFGKKTIIARLSAKYRGYKSNASISIKLRLEKDKTIWMSATKLGIPVAKVKMTPDRVIYYEKIQKVYFDGDFSLLSKWLGTELDFYQVQNMLLGQSLFNLNDGKFVARVENEAYTITPRRNPKLYSFLLTLNPDNYKMDKQEIRHRKKDQVLSVSYRKYRDIMGEQFPQELKIRTLDKNRLTTIDIEYRQVAFDKRLTFPFTIPKGYKALKLN